MEASKSQFLADLDIELESIGETTAPPAAPKRRRHLAAAALAMVAPLGMMFDAAPAAAAAGIGAEPTVGIMGCSDFYKPDYVARTHTKKCRQILAVYAYKHTKTENGGTVRCHWFVKTTIMPCAIPTNEGYVSACGH